MSYGGTTLDILLRWTAKHEWVIGLALGSLAAIGVAFFLFLSSNIEATPTPTPSPTPSPTDGIVAVPQPTDTRVCTEVDWGRFSVPENPPGPGHPSVTKVLYSSWSTSDCNSITTGHPAAFYTFQLADPGHVTIDLESDDADAYLILRRNGLLRRGEVGILYSRTTTMWRRQKAQMPAWLGIWTGKPPTP